MRIVLRGQQWVTLFGEQVVGKVCWYKWFGLEWHKGRVDSLHFAPVGVGIDGRIVSLNLVAIEGDFKHLIHLSQRSLQYTWLNRKGA